MLGGSFALAQPRQQDEPLDKLEAILPHRPLGFTAETTARVRELADAAERLEYRESLYDPGSNATAILLMVEDLVAAKNRVDRLLKQTMEIRSRFADEAAGQRRREAIRQFLATTSALTDLSGRIRYVSYDALHEVAYDLRNNAQARTRLLELLTQNKSSIGASVMAQVMLVPPRGEPNAGLTSSGMEQSLALKLIRETRQHDLLGLLANYARRTTDPRLTITAAATIRRVGLPQSQRPGADPTLPKPAILAEQLHELLNQIDASRLGAEWVSQRDELLRWLDIRMTEGEPDDTYRIGNIEVKAGDWLLMRNPSPYNLFTDLSPGLFTHVGVVTVERGSDGIRRFLLVDLPETENRMPAVTVDTFVKRTLDYAFLRHADESVGEAMGDAARSIIGNESHFDLQFRTDGIVKLKGKDLRGEKIHGYCAGLLLLCAQQTDAPLSDFFPIPEHPAEGYTLANFAKLGVSMGHDFLSPTGPLLSQQMLLVGRREPMYDPRRQIEQAVYDHFANSMEEKQLTPSPDWYQSMRQSMAEASQNNPLLAKALAAAAGVNENMDLVAAAKLGAVVETLDKIAYGASGEFLQARAAMRVEVPRGPRRRLQADERLQQAIAYQRRHANLHQAFASGNLSPRDLRKELVRYYITRGNRQLDARFFQPPAKD